MIDKVMRVVAGEKRHADEMRIITIYRYVSLLSISFFFFAGSENLTIVMKTFIVASITISALILNYLYQRNHDISGNIKLLVIIETLGNSLFLIPTGGLNSPFVWYSINTILISAVMLEGLYCWIILSTYLFTSTYIAYLIFGNAASSFIVFAASKSNLILSLILITAIIRQLAMYIRMLRVEGIKQAEMNKQLSYANHKVRESINHIMELYQTVYMFTTLNDKEDMISTIVEYTGKVTKVDFVFFFSFADDHCRISSRVNKGTKADTDTIETKIAESKDVLINASNPVELEIDGNTCLVAVVGSSCITYGALGIKVESDQLAANYLDYFDQMKFMSGLSSIVFEKFEVEQVNERLVITDEQNRIANEIHDSVLQRLFSTSFGIYSLMKNVGSMAESELAEELDTIRNSIDNAMKELRTAIYSMSWNKDGKDNFIVDILRFIEETRRLNDIDIKFKLQGNNELLTLLQKKSIYRIICEGVGNAVRHGNAKNVNILLQIESGIIVLKINDDGAGFDPKLLGQSRQRGLGIKNIEALAQYLKGRANICSSIGKGTEVKIVFPVFTYQNREENII